MRRHGLCFLLDTICQLNCGADYNSIQWGYKPEDVRNGYDYLISSAFMSTVDTNSLPDELKNSRITPRGAELIERENREGRSKTKFKAYIAVRGNFGVASFEAGGEMTSG